MNPLRKWARAICPKCAERLRLRKAGPMTFRSWRTVTLHRDGRPLTAGDLVEGEQYEVNIETGEVK